MSNKKRDRLLIGLLLVVFGVILIATSALQKPGNFAYIKVKDDILFSIDLRDGTFKTNPLEVVVTSVIKPVINGDKIIVDNQVSYELTLGKGIIRHNDTYYIMGNLGYVLIEYEAKKIRVKQETSPYNICSKQGFSDTKPIICMPNFVTIEFNDVEVDVSV